MADINPAEDVEFFVAFNDDGSFKDLVRSDVNGLFFRSEASSWIPAPPEYLLNELDGSDIVDVSEVAIQLVDDSRTAEAGFGITREDALKYPPEDE